MTDAWALLTNDDPSSWCEGLQDGLLRPRGIITAADFEKAKLDTEIG